MIIFWHILHEIAWWLDKRAGQLWRAYSIWLFDHGYEDKSMSNNLDWLPSTATRFRYYCQNQLTRLRHKNDV